MRGSPMTERSRTPTACPRARRDVKSARVILTVAVLSFAITPARAQTIPGEAVVSKGLRADRSYFSPLPFEHFDPSNGNVVLTFTDLELPGNGGRSLRFTRTYNSQSAP